MSPVGPHRRSRGALLGTGAVALLFASGAVMSIAMTLQDARVRGVLHEVRHKPSKTAFHGRVRWKATMRGEPLEVKVDFAHWEDDQSRVQLVEVVQAPDRFKMMALAMGGKPRSAGHMGRMWSRLLQNERLLLANYKVEITAVAAVLGREADELKIRPLRPNRPSLDLVVDRETRLPLKTISRGRDGSTVFEMQFEAVTFGTPQGAPGTPSQRRGRRSRSETVSLAEARRRYAGLRLPRRIPAGFRLHTVSLMNRGTKAGEAPGAPTGVSLTYTDGLAQLRLMQFEPGEKSRYRGTGHGVRKGPHKGQRKRGGPVPPQYRSREITRGDRTYAVSSHTMFAVIKTESAGRKVILVGPVADEELLDCMDSINWD